MIRSKCLFYKEKVLFVQFLMVQDSPCEIKGSQNGIQEVARSIRVSSTNKIKHLSL